MYLDALEFLEEEREAWAPFEALAGLTDAQLEAPVEAAHGWSGRDLMAHMLAWQGLSLEVAKELAVNETSPAIAGRMPTGTPAAARSSTPRSRRSGRRCRWPSCASSSGPSPASCAAT